MTDSSLRFPPAWRGTLCHPDGSKSCGACCGMYNVRSAADRAIALRDLKERTLAFRHDANIQDPESLAQFRARWEPKAEEKLLDELPTCHFLGLLDVFEEQDRALDSRVGCLVHPLQNEGIDGRDCGVYDREICESYLCAAHELLREHEKWLVIRAVNDSYVYGLVITDVKFVRELFLQTARLNGEEVPPVRLKREPALATARAYFQLKSDWPYRAPEDGIFGQLRAGAGLDTPRRSPSHESLGVPPSPWAAILTTLGTQVADLHELEEARAAVSARVEAFASAVSL